LMMKLKKIQGVEPKKRTNEALYEAIAAIKTVSEARLFFEDLCTPAERQAMEDRWLIIPAIKEGRPYREIYDKTGVSVTTIGRVARCLTWGTGGYNLILERLKRLKNANKKKA
jgi:TrpR-related protein YerC/YecD